MDRDSLYAAADGPAPAPGAPADPPAGPIDGPRRGLVGALRDTTFRSLRHRNYRLYFAGQLVSFTGTWMQSAALMWLLYDRTGDPRWPSWLLVAQVGPTLLFGPLGGALADRVHKPTLILGTQFAFLLNAVLLAVLVATDHAGAWVVLGLQMFNGLVQAIDLPSRLAFVPDLVPREDLVNAIGLNSLLFNSARAVGPAVAGFLFWLVEAADPALPGGMTRVRLGATVCFGVNAVSFVAVLFALRAIRVPNLGAAERGKRGGSFWEGFRYLAGHRTLGGLVLITLGLCVFGWPVQTLLPAYTREVIGHGEQSYSLLVSGVGAGALVAALLTATFGGGRRRGPFLVAGATAAGCGLLGLAAAGGLLVAVPAAALTGFGLILYLSTGQSALQMSVPDDKRGRVMALWAMTMSASAPLGHLIAGEAVAAFGVSWVLRGMAVGVLTAAAGLTFLVRRARLREE